MIKDIKKSRGKTRWKEGLKITKYSGKIEATLQPNGYICMVMISYEKNELFNQQHNSNTWQSTT